MSGDLAGQWIGVSTGDPVGKIILDIDRVKHGWSGTAHLFPEQEGLPSSVVSLAISSDADLNSLNATVRHFMPATGVVLTDLQLSEIYPDATFPNAVNIKIEISDDGNMHVSWVSNIQTFGVGELRLANPGNESKINAEPAVTTWVDFKRELLGHEFGEHIYRGQCKNWPLKTSFHRSNRKDLSRYLSEDVPALRRVLSSRTKHYFDTNVPEQFGAFMGLVQHHGYPTPLLDWTYSPFVAAWFAFSDRKKCKDAGGSVRIFCINKEVFEGFNHYNNITLAPPHFSLLETLTIENPRIGPQQGLLTLTNLNDIEAHVLELQDVAGTKLIQAYDIVVVDIDEALNDLALMGITRSTLFPSIDSALEDMKLKRFPSEP